MGSVDSTFEHAKHNVVVAFDEAGHLGTLAGGELCALRTPVRFVRTSLGKRLDDGMNRWIESAVDIQDELAKPGQTSGLGHSCAKDEQDLAAGMGKEKPFGNLREAGPKATVTPLPRTNSTNT